MKRPTLILGAVPRIAVPIARSLHKRGIVVDVASASALEPALRSRAIRHLERLPADGLLAREALMRLATQRGYDTLIPANDTALSFLSELDTELRRLLQVACPRREVVGKVLDKSITLQIAGSIGIPVPVTCHVSDSSAMAACVSRLRFPIIAKPSHPDANVDFKVRRFSTLDEFEAAFSASSQWHGPILLQEFVTGVGVGVEVLMHAGEALAIFQHRRLREVPSTGGVASEAIAESINPSLAQSAIALLRALEWEGVAMVEFRHDPATSLYTLMEVNGRYWGTVALPIQAGVDFPWYQWQVLHGEMPSIATSYAAGTRWRWTAGAIARWHGDALRREKRGTDIARDLPGETRRRVHDALWGFGDPVPAIAELTRQLGTLLGADVRAVCRRVFGRKSNAGHASTSLNTASKGHLLS